MCTTVELALMGLLFLNSRTCSLRIVVRGKEELATFRATML